MRRTLVLLALIGLVGAACSKAGATLPSISPIPTPSISTSPPPPMVPMPDVVGLKFDAAREALKAEGFVVSRRERYTSKSPAEEVLAQSRKVGDLYLLGSKVTLTVARAIPAAVNGNPWGYNFGCCKKIYSPPSDFCTWFVCVTTFYNGEGYVVQCDDFQYSQTGGSKQVCAAHEGYNRTLFDPSGV